MVCVCMVQRQNWSTIAVWMQARRVHRMFNSYVSFKLVRQYISAFAKLAYRWGGGTMHSQPPQARSNVHGVEAVGRYLKSEGNLKRMAVGVVRT